MKPDFDENRIVELFKKRDEAAIHEASRLYGNRLRAVAYRICGDEQMAEECENDAYLEAWNRIPPHEPKGYLFPFLAKIVRAKALNRIKQEDAKKRSAELVELSEELACCIPSKDDVESTLEAKELTSAINRFIRSLPGQKRNIFIRRYWYLDSIDKIAKDYGMSESKVKSLLFRLRNKLKIYLEKENGGTL